jgi:thiamine-phosphate pyrophosphorylase
VDSAVTPSLRLLKPLADCQLYTFLDTTYLAGRDPCQLARQLCDGGTDIIQLRAKGLPLEAVRRMAGELISITRANGVWLVINDHIDVALEVGAPGCHLGQEDFSECGAQAISDLTPAGSELSIGLSTHAPEQAKHAVAAGANYLGVGPVFATPTKPTALPVTLEYVRWASHHIQVPWFAIGGITLMNLDSVLKAGARRICVVSAILNAGNVRTACREFRAGLDTVKGELHG